MRIARLVTAALAATTLAVIAGAAPAFAHNALTKAVPAKNAIVTETPAKIELTFLDSLDDSFSIEVTDAQKQKVPTGDASVDGKQGTAKFTDDLANGTYTVTYKLVADDGDPVQGSYKFTVRTISEGAPSGAAVTSAPASATPPATPQAVTATATIAASDSSSNDGPNWGLIIAIIAGVLVVAAGAILFARRRQNP